MAYAMQRNKAIQANLPALYSDFYNLSNSIVYNPVGSNPEDWIAHRKKTTLLVINLTAWGI
jgi:hypothetical protein